MITISNCRTAIRRIRPLLALLAVWPTTVLANPATAGADRPPARPQEVNFTLEGKIYRQSPGKLTVRTEENMVFRVSYDENTEIKRPDGSAGSAKDLRVGVKVKVEGELAESGEVRAVRIELEKNSTTSKPGAERDVK